MASVRLAFSLCVSGGTSLRLFKDVHKLAVAARHLRHGSLACCLSGTIADERLPAVGPTHREADKPRNSCRCCKPFANLGVVFAAPEDDASNLIMASPVGCRHNFLAVLAAIESSIFQTSASAPASSSSSMPLTISQVEPPGRKPSGRL